MTPVEFATKYIYFEKSSPISGTFDIAKYPFLAKPLLTLDNINVKRHVVYKASSGLGSVFLQIAMAYRMAQRPGDAMLVNQSDDDAGEWMKTRGEAFFNRIPPIVKQVSNKKYATTNSLWQLVNQFLIITGPGLNSRQSKQVRYLYTDESHVPDYEEGSLAEFEERMSKRWDRYALHVTTAADAEKEVDGFYYLGGQNEWHHRCLKCGKIFWLLWDDEAKEEYNGERVFIYDATELIIQAHCPHCDSLYDDTPRQRYELCRYGDYECKNVLHLEMYESHRWNCFAAHWIPWVEQLVKYREALAAARMGDLKPHENFKKKRLCVSYKPEIPDLGDSPPHQDYKCGDVWIVEEDRANICSFDLQDKGGRHWWGQVDCFTKDGKSRRLAFARLETKEQCREFQLHHNVNDSNTAMDYGFSDREVFGICAAWKWYALKSTDDFEFTHFITDASKKRIPIPRPYSVTQMQDSMSGLSGRKITKVRSVPVGYCLARMWSKPATGFLLMRLKCGSADRYYGIATDLTPEYQKQLHSYIEGTQLIKKTGITERFLRKVKEDDHAFTTSSQNLILAMIAGYFPMPDCK
jgi:hypothetical protein